ncbi:MULTISPECIES: hypothetical protein [unclassified Nocardioides]|uniref:hypothetical protein n=1 Tax=unclassified Nocardioides TaxID=2615069 RepID=UPI003014F557
MHDETLPGDELLPDADRVTTREIAIAAPPAAVWPWIAQLGQGRAGFYSHAWLENLVGCRIVNADRVVPEWQDVRVGDEVRLHPRVALAVREVRPGRALVLSGPEPTGRSRLEYDFGWAFVVLPDSGTGGSRLVVRERYRCPTRAARVLVAVLSGVSGVMSARMLRGIRDRSVR